MKPTALFVLLALACFGSGCSGPYYSAMEKLGFPKREILVDRIEKSRDAQDKAKEQFTSALQRFQAVTKLDGGDLQKKYEELSRDYSRSEARAKDVRNRIAAVEDVADALFKEWKQELKEYSNANLRRESERELDRTQARYNEVLRSMRKAADRMDPVLAAFHDQVLFLKHNLNAQVLASLATTQAELETNISRLVADMEASIKEAEEFIRTLKQEPAAK